MNGKIENEKEISRILTIDLKSKVSIEKSFTDIKEFVLSLKKILNFILHRFHAF